MSEPSEMPHAAVGEQKKALRTALRPVRQHIEPQIRKKASNHIVDTLLAAQIVAASKVVLIYAALEEEVNLDALIAPLTRQGKRVLVPRFGRVPGLMTLWQVRQPSALIDSKKTFGVRQPDVSLTQPAEPKDVDLVLVPGLAFDPKGRRLGFGGGYYDRLLPKCAPHCQRLGIAFAAQLCEELPSEAHDVPMHAVLTESVRHGQLELLASIPIPVSVPEPHHEEPSV
ncbi:MAG: hypothetical protein RLZZ502_452 [Pseudomonadota bacterium]